MESRSSSPESSLQGVRSSAELGLAKEDDAKEHQRDCSCSESQPKQEKLGTSAVDSAEPFKSATMEVVRVTPGFDFLEKNHHLQELVPVAMDRALTDVLSRVVERAVMCSCLNTKDQSSRKRLLRERDMLITVDDGCIVIMPWHIQEEGSGRGSLGTLVDVRQEAVHQDLHSALQRHLWRLLHPHMPQTPAAHLAAEIKDGIVSLAAENLALMHSLIEAALGPDHDMVKSKGARKPYPRWQQRLRLKHRALTQSLPEVLL